MHFRPIFDLIFDIFFFSFFFLPKRQNIDKEKLNNEKEKSIEESWFFRNRGIKLLILLFRHGMERERIFVSESVKVEASTLWNIAWRNIMWKNCGKYVRKKKRLVKVNWILWYYLPILSESMPCRSGWLFSSRIFPMHDFYLLALVVISSNNKKDRLLYRNLFFPFLEIDFFFILSFGVSIILF